MEIIPGILETEWGEIEKKLELVKPFAKTVHIDLIDGKFASHKTFSDPEPFKKYMNQFLLELHMMVEEPVQYLDPFFEAGFKRFLGHVEKAGNVEEFVAQGQLLGEVGLGLDLGTNIEEIKVPFEDLDCLLIMGVEAGASGQKFNEESLEKVKKLSAETFLPLQIDGGVNEETIKKAKEVGAERVVVNSYLFEGDPEENYKKLLSLV